MVWTFSPGSDTGTIGSETGSAVYATLLAGPRHDTSGEPTSDCTAGRGKLTTIPPVDANSFSSLGPRSPLGAFACFAGHAVLRADVAFGSQALGLLLVHKRLPAILLSDVPTLIFRDAGLDR